MTLVEIAKYVLKTDTNASKYIDSNFLDDELLLEPLMNYYMYWRLDLCGCGTPENTYEVIRNILQIRKDYTNNSDMTYDDLLATYSKTLNLDVNQYMHDGILQFILYTLDAAGFLDHGSSIGGCWLTRDGEMLLEVLNEWRKTQVFSLGETIERLEKELE